MTKVWPSWSPSDLKNWLERFDGDHPSWPKPLLQYMEMLATEPRMREVWEWHDAASKGARAPKLMTSMSLCMNTHQAKRMPGKPGNMTPKKRDAYLAKVKEHAIALHTLLMDTRFDRNMMQELTEEELDKSLDEVLSTWGDDEDEEGHVVGFHVSTTGRSRLDYDFPRSSLVRTLEDVIIWTSDDDNWDGNPLKSSDPIVQVNGSSARIVYFTCTVFDSLARWGVLIPFNVLATLTNVALDLPFSEQVEEGTVRKQVRRYHARQRASGRETYANRAAAEGGHNCLNSNSSVLFDEF